MNLGYDGRDYNPVWIFDILARMPAVIDQIIRSKRKTIAIIIHQDGRVIVRAPLKTPERLIRGFVERKSGWINEKKAQALQHPALPMRKFADGEKFLVLGRQIQMRLVEKQKAALTLQSEFNLSRQALPQAAVVFEKWYKAYARQILDWRVQYFSALHAIPYEKIRISSARTRWGSCSSLGALSFTWRLVMAPLEVVDYVVIHELVHIKIKNHSTVFWDEVARLMPEYKKRKDWLKKNGRLLNLGSD
jgi:predicted metal-dependent hydrolase